MKVRRHVGSWMPRVGLCLVAGLLLVAGLAPGGVLGADRGPEIREAPTRQVEVVPHPPGTGYLPPPVDLSHVTGQALPRDARPEALPAVFDWRTSGKVTPVKNQANCGSCYAFSFVGSFESKLLIDGAGTWDLSENHAKECNWKEVNNYQSPPGSYWGSCDGGNSFMIANLYSQTGSVLESCDPYQDSDVACSTGCPYQQSVLDFRVISGSSVPSTEVLKQYIYDHGPIATSVYVDEGQGFNSSYNGTTTLNYSAPSGQTNHGVVIVGWSNNLPPVPGGSTPATGWIVKNSWGTGWGDSGFFYMTYGAANIGYNSVFVDEWQTYDTGGDIWYYDEDGWGTSFGTGSSTTTWGLAKYIPGSNTNVTRVEFWTTDVTTDVDVYLYDDFNGTSTSNLLASKLNNSFAEAGYHSVALDSPVPVATGDDVIAVVKFTNSSYAYPVPADDNGPIETARTYISLTGGSGTWVDLSDYDADVAIRLRTSAGGAPAPTVTSITPNSGQNTGTVHITNLAGSNFQPGATVKLAKSGQADINATSVVVVNSSQITCDFNLAGAATGAWNVVVTNPDMQSGTLANGFTVTLPGGEDYYVYLPLAMRRWPPVPYPPALNPISNPDGDGNYAVSWSAADGATTYQLHEDDNAAFSSPAEVYSGSGTSTSISGRAPGTYYYRVRGWNSFGFGGWSGTQPVTVQSTSGWTTIKAETFEGPFPNDWDVDDTNASSGEYYWGKRTCRPYAGSYSGWAVGGGDGASLACGTNYPTYVVGWMVYGPFSLADATAADLTFQLWLNTELNYDKVLRAASIDGNDFYGYSTSGNTGGWTAKTLDLAAVPTLGNLTGRSNVWIALVFISDSTITYAEGAHVDNIVLRKYVGSRTASAEEELPVAPATVRDEVMQLRLVP